MHEEEHAGVDGEVSVALYEVVGAVGDGAAEAGVVVLLGGGVEFVGEGGGEVFGVDFVVAEGVGAGGGLWVLVEVDEFDDVGVVDGCAFDELTVVKGEFFFCTGLEGVAVYEFVGEFVAEGVGGEGYPIFGEEVVFVFC